MRKILFRADGSAKIGLGHVIRSLALAEMLKNDFYCVFAIQEPIEELYQQITAVCSQIVVLPKAENKDKLEQELDTVLKGDEIVILDGYKFDTDYQRKIKSRGCTLVCIDDIHAYHFVADMIINHGIHNGSVYSKEVYTKMLLGTDYCLLRQPFLLQMKTNFFPKSENNIFLCFGGSDATNLTCVYLERLLRIEGMGTIHVVVGSAFQQRPVLQQIVQKNKNADVRVHQNISAQEMLEVIRTCKVAIVPGSTVAIECASTGIPMMCGYYVDNQHDIVKMLGNAGLAVTVGDFTLLEEFTFVETLQNLLKEELFQWFERSKIFFDGRAKDRFIRAFNQLYLIRQISVRKATESDVDLYFTWANDPLVRQNAVNKEPIVFENHYMWFNNKLHSSHSYLYVVAVHENEFGQVRFDYEENSFNIDYSICYGMRGKGLAPLMLDAAINQLQHDLRKPFKLHALVKADNTASLKVFSCLQFHPKGYKQIGSTEYRLFERQIEG